jgi:hypothetical protein
MKVAGGPIGPMEIELALLVDFDGQLTARK